MQGGWTERAGAAVIGLVVAAAGGAAAAAGEDADADRAAVAAWLDSDGAGVVRMSLGADPEWSASLGLDDPDATVSFGVLHGYRAVDTVPDYDLPTHTTLGATTLAANVSAAPVEYCARLVVDATATDVAVCAAVDGGEVRLTTVGQMHLEADLSALGPDVDFVSTGPVGLYAIRGATLVPLDAVAVYHVGREPVDEGDFFSAFAKRNAERLAIEKAEGEPIAGGYPPLLAGSDPETEAAWDAWVSESLAADAADRSRAAGEWWWAGAAVLLVAGAGATSFTRRRRVATATP